MNEPKWLEKDFVLLLHENIIKEANGLQGVRDDGLLESALSRPHNIYSYEGGDIFDLAAAYALGISSNHSFFDGNKRTAFAAAGIFLEDNGIELGVQRENEQTKMFLAVANGEVTRKELADWYKENTREIELDKNIVRQRDERAEPEKQPEKHRYKLPERPWEKNAKPLSEAEKLKQAEQRLQRMREERARAARGLELDNGRELER